MVQSTDAQAADKGGMLSFGGERADNSSGALPLCAIAGRKENGTSGNYAAYLQFGTRANGGQITEKMRITSNGEINIGYGILPVGNNSTPKVLISNLNTTSTERPDSYLFINDSSVYDTYPGFNTLQSPKIHLQIIGNHAATTDNMSVGLDLANDDDHNDTWSPFICFSRRSEGNNYQSAFAAIGGISRSTAGDVNWVGGDLTFHSAPLTTQAGPLERMRITGNGYVGIGTNNPETHFVMKGEGINGSGLARFESTHTGTTNTEGVLVYYPSTSPNNDGWAFYFLDGTEGKFIVRNNGDVESRTNDYGGWSDERIKTNIEDASSQWDDIKNIKVRNFKFKSAVERYGEDAEKFLGTVAQEVELVSPSLVKEVAPSKYEIEKCGFGEQNEDEEWVVKKDDDGEDMTVKTMKYSILYMKAIKALQEAMERIETLETQMAQISGSS
jgi:hypothetical protein